MVHWHPSQPRLLQLILTQKQRPASDQRPLLQHEGRRGVYCTLLNLALSRKSRPTGAGLHVTKEAPCCSMRTGTVVHGTPLILALTLGFKPTHAVFQRHSDCVSTHTSRPHPQGRPESKLNLPSTMLDAAKWGRWALVTVHRPYHASQVLPPFLPRRMFARKLLVLIL